MVLGDQLIEAAHSPAWSAGLTSPHAAAEPRHILEAARRRIDAHLAGGARRPSARMRPAERRAASQ